MGAPRHRAGSNATAGGRVTSRVASATEPGRKTAGAPAAGNVRRGRWSLQCFCESSHHRGAMPGMCWACTCNKRQSYAPEGECLSSGVLECRCGWGAQVGRSSRFLSSGELSRRMPVSQRAVRECRHPNPKKTGRNRTRHFHQSCILASESPALEIEPRILLTPLSRLVDQVVNHARPAQRGCGRSTETVSYIGHDRSRGFDHPRTPAARCVGGSPPAALAGARPPNQARRAGNRRKKFWKELLVTC